MAETPSGALREATFAGGCFWCMQPPYDKLDGVVGTTAGYTGGHDPAPTYSSVSSGTTGHYEAVRVVYDPARVTYGALLDAFWASVDPTDAGGQFADRGPQYQTAIFFHDEQQRREAEASLRAVDASGRFPNPVATRILPASTFYPAEEYHQQYYRKNKVHYEAYKEGSGRAAFLRRKR